MKIGILLFDNAEELDFVGPYEVFNLSAVLHKMQETGETGPAVNLIAEKTGPLTAFHGLTVQVDYDLDSAPPLDVVLVPGGFGTREVMKNRRIIDWLAAQAPDCTWVTSVCTGSLVLSAAGLTKDKRITTHWSAFDEFEKNGLEGELVRDARYVRDGNLVTSAGVSAGIDMTLWLLGQIYSPAHARDVQRAMEYDPAPPYQAAV